MDRILLILAMPDELGIGVWVSRVQKWPLVLNGNRISVQRRRRSLAVLPLGCSAACPCAGRIQLEAGSSLQMFAGCHQLAPTWLGDDGTYQVSSFEGIGNLDELPAPESSGIVDGGNPEGTSRVDLDLLLPITLT